MKRFIKIAELLVIFIVMGMQAFAQAPTYSCVATADTLMTSSIYQFDIYIYKTGSTDLYLNNYQLSFKINNSASILNGGTLTGVYVAGSSALPTAFLPGGVSIFNIGGTIYVRVNGCVSSSNGTLVPTTGLRIGSFRITNTSPFGQVNPNTIWWNSTPATTHLYAIVPPASTGTIMEISDIASHSTALTDPIFNAPVISYNMTGSGTYCFGLSGLPIGLDGSQAGVQYRLIKNSNPVGSYIPGTGSALSFGNQTEGTYTATAYRKATYLTNGMNGSAIVIQSTITPTISGNNMVCQGSPGNVYTTESGMTNYIWNVSAGGTITAGGTLTSNSVTVTWNTAGVQTVSVNYTNSSGCTAPSSTVYNVSVSAIPVPTITGPNGNICAGNGYNSYSTQSGNSNYVWTISSGGIIVSGQGTSSIDVFWNAPGSQWLAVNYTNSSGCTAQLPTQLNVTVLSSPGAAGAITGTSMVCAGTQAIAYSVDPISNALTYMWTLPSGATIVSGAGTNNITVNFSSNAVSGNLTVYGNNTCGNGSTSPPYEVNVETLPAGAGQISGRTKVCRGSTGVPYSVGTISGADGYVWSVPPGVDIMSGSNTNMITVNFTNSAQSGSFQVYGTNSCGNGPMSPSYFVIVGTPPPTPIIIIATDKVVKIGDTLHSSVPEGNQWYVNSLPIPGATKDILIVSSTGTYFVLASNGSCCSDTSNLVIVGTTGIEDLESARYIVYPVPNWGVFTAQVTTSYQETYHIMIFNTLGVMVYKTKEFTVNGKHEEVIDVRDLPSGIYSVIFTNDHKKVVRKIFINK